MPSLVRSLRLLLSAGVVGALLLAAGCQEALSGPRVLETSIEPDTISSTENTGMTDQYFRVEMQTTGFDSEIETVEMFAQLDSGERPSPPPEDSEQYPQINDDRTEIILDTIPQTWFGQKGGQQVPPGVYQIGTEIVSADTKVRQRNLTEVEVTE